MSEYQTISLFDRMLGAMQGLPDVVQTKPSTIVAILPLVGAAQTYVVQTVRQRSGDGDDAKSRDTCFLQSLSAEGNFRIVLPHDVVAAIRRQADALGTKNRKRAAKRVAAARKEAGVPLPLGFRKKRQ